MASIQDSLQYLYKLKNRGVKLNLDRVYRFQEILDFPDRSYDSIHIAGTNGKGSVSHFLAALFKEAGAKTGLYTSPHLVEFNERVQVNGQKIPDDFIAQFISQWRNIIDELQLTYFEATTLMAMDFFRDQEVDIAILETGLGGRLDATNIVTPLISVITSIGLEHTDVLGDTMEKIAREKAGIMKENIPCVIGKMAAEVDAALKIHADKKSAPLFCVQDLIDMQSVQVSETGTVFQLIDNTGANHSAYLQMIGEQAALNSTIALTAFQIQNRWELELSKQIEVLGRVQIPGRLQKLSEDPAIFYDVAHNYDSLKQLLVNVQNIFSGASLRFLLGLGVIKDIVRLREVFNGEGSIGVMTSDEMPMHPPEKWKNAFPDLEVINYGKGSAAVAKFKSDLDKTDIGIIAGSHYIASNVYDVLNFSLDRNQ